MRSNYRTKIGGNLLLLTILLFMMIIIVTACHQTPEQGAVTQKGSGILEEGILQTASPVEPSDSETYAPESWKYEKEYSSGHRLVIDASIDNMSLAGIPVISVKERPFKEGDQLKDIVKIFCPNAKVYDVGMLLTKSQIEENIIMFKEDLYKLKSERDQKDGGSNQVMDYQAAEEWLNSEIARLEEEYKTAPSDSDLEEANFEFKFAEDSYQSNLKAIEGDRIVRLNFVNWNIDGGTYSGSEFSMQDEKYENTDALETFADPALLLGDAAFANERKRVDQCLQAMGIDYMELDSVTKNTNGYQYYYTRSEKGFAEIYTNVYLGTPQNEPEGMIFKELFKPEYLEVITQRGQIVRIFWKNPTEVTKEDNNNVKVIPWSKVQEIFLQQIDRILTPEPMSNVDEKNATVFPEATEININRIELGLTKVLMHESQNDYKLIPTWNFMGYDKTFVEPDVTPGADVCFVTINAIDGTIIDRGLMY